MKKILSSYFVRRNGAIFGDKITGVQKIMITQSRARMLMQSKVSMHVETVVLLSRVK